MRRLLLVPVLVLVLAGFADGTYRIGSGPGQVPAGTYAAPGGRACSWARLGPAGRVLAKGSGRAVQRVVVARTDASFRTKGCGDWKRVPTPPATTTSTTRPVTTTTTATPPASTSTTVAVPTTSTTLPTAVQGALCEKEGAVAVTADGLPLDCNRTACNGTVFPRPRWRRTGCR